MGYNLLSISTRHFKSCTERIRQSHFRWLHNPKLSNRSVQRVEDRDGSGCRICGRRLHDHCRGCDANSHFVCSLFEMVQPQPNARCFHHKIVLHTDEKTGIPAKQIWRCPELPWNSFKALSLGRMGRMGQVFLPSACGK